MRAFVLMVLVLNVLFFVWHYISSLAPQEAEEVALVPSAAGSVAPSLVLISDVSSIALNVKEAKENQSAAVTVAQPLVAVAEVKPEPRPEPIKTAVARPSAQTVQPELAVEIDKVDVAASPSPVSLCYKAGPFKQRAEPQELVAMVEQHGFDAAITARKVEHLLGEWIYLTEYETIKPARADVMALKAQGIKDVAIARLDNGELIISLGIFGQEASLKRRLQELRRLGYVNYQTRRHYREVEAFWLVLSGFEGDQQRILTDELGVVLSDRFPVAQLATVGCR
ncbi:hypothetical protein MNBD_GAMMA17-698 [hydrothermal vent metagenome]|uniref:SPOR domain-containing protein n=1 Tax=hydrothermal vent metagenome TaxID=652676 RepID=A0A3B0ZQI3_9ZZZZ